MPLPASDLETVVGSVRGEDGAIWYQTNDFYYVPSTGVFLASQSGAYTGRWLLATLTPTTRVVAYEGQTAVRTMPALRGIPRYPTPTGVFSIQRRVPNEIMDSLTVGIPRITVRSATTSPTCCTRSTSRPTAPVSTTTTGARTSAASARTGAWG